MASPDDVALTPIERALAAALVSAIVHELRGAPATDATPVDRDQERSAPAVQAEALEEPRKSL